MGVSKTIAFATPPGIPPGTVGRMFIRPYVEMVHGWQYSFHIPFILLPFHRIINDIRCDIQIGFFILDDVGKDAMNRVSTRSSRRKLRFRPFRLSTDPQPNTP
jgi:hypothetical protein